MTGRFIVIEGLDGAGTTTQSALLADHLDATLTHEPTDRPIGRLIRRILQSDPGAAHPSTLPWLFAADRADHLVSTIEPALQAGRDVVSDRYYHSSLAYQSLSVPLEQVLSLNATFRAPDLTLFLDIPVDVACQRIANRKGEAELFEREDSLARIQARYDVVIAHLRQRGERIERIDATGTVAEIAEQIRGLL